MRVIRTANISLSRQFQWRQLTKASNSNTQWRSRSNVASARSDNPEPKKLGKRLSKQERRYVLQNYVNKYRATNGGKFPTASEAKRDVGGSFYVVREILQELKYNSEVPPVEKIGATSVEKDAVENDETSTDVGDVSQSQELVEVIKNGGAPIDVNPCSSCESRSEAGSVEHSQIRADSRAEVEAILHSHPEADIKQESKSEDNVEFDGPQSKTEPQQSAKPETSEREFHEVPTKVAPQTKSSVWQNLKSFASGVFDKWRRLLYL